MDPNEERQLNDKKAERLAKRTERRRQRMLEETAFKSDFLEHKLAARRDTQSE